MGSVTSVCVDAFGEDICIRDEVVYCQAGSFARGVVVGHSYGNVITLRDIVTSELREIISSFVLKSSSVSSSKIVVDDIVVTLPFFKKAIVTSVLGDEVGYRFLDGVMERYTVRSMMCKVKPGVSLKWMICQ